MNLHEWTRFFGHKLLPQSDIDVCTVSSDLQIGAIGSTDTFVLGLSAIFHVADPVFGNTLYAYWGMGHG